MVLLSVYTSSSKQTTFSCVNECPPLPHSMVCNQCVCGEEGIMYDFVSAVDLLSRVCEKLQRRTQILHPKYQSPVKTSVTVGEAG
jgi:hypothetical protein